MSAWGFSPHSATGTLYYSAISKVSFEVRPNAFPTEGPSDMERAVMTLLQ